MSTSKRPKAQMRKLLNLVTKVREEHGDIPLQQLQMLLTIALNDGESQQTIQKMANQTRASASRNIQAWSVMDRKHQPGPGFVEMRPDPYERRRNLIYLTKQGET